MDVGEDEDGVVRGCMDRISQLPQHVFHHILSFLSQKDAVKTCVLSKSFSYLSSTRPNVEFSESDFKTNPESFSHVVERTLQGYLDQNLRIHKFCLHIEYCRSFLSLLEKWVPKVVCDLGVKNLELIANRKHGSHHFDLPPELFEAQSLQQLYLQQCRWTPYEKLLLFKRLTTLRLKYVIIEDGDFEKIMSSCPLIEHVVLRRCQGLTTINYVNDHNFNLNYFEFSCGYFEWDKSELGVSIKICTPSIATLKIKWCHNWIHSRLYYPNLKCLRLNLVTVKDGDFEKIMSSCPLIERVVLLSCDGLRTVNYVDNHNFNLKYFHFATAKSCEGVVDIRIHTPSIRTIVLDRCPDWIIQHRHLYYPSLKCLRLFGVRVSEDVFDGFSSSFPCLEELELGFCGLVEFKLSSPSIKHLEIGNMEELRKAAIDAPKIVLFEYESNADVASISFATTCNEWKSCVKTRLFVCLEFDVSSWLLKTSELLTGLRQSEITLDITLLGSGYQQQFLGVDIPGRLVPDSGFYNKSAAAAAVAVEHLRLEFVCVYSASSFPRFIDALFRVCRPRKMGPHQWYAVDYHWEHSREQNGITKSLCTILRKDEYCGDDQLDRMSWQQELEEVILEVLLDENEATGGMWHPVLATTNWSEYCDALAPKKRRENEPDESYKIRFQLRWC